MLRKVTTRVNADIPGRLIKNIVSPLKLGEKLKPFVFLDFLQGQIPAGFGFGFHPHSGIATVTYQLSVDVAYTDTEGHEGILKAGGIEFMRAGGGAWHRGSFVDPSFVTGFQMWMALPPVIEDGPSYSEYVEPSAVPVSDNVKILLGSFKDKKSIIETPGPMNYFDIVLKKDENFDYIIPQGHSVSWIFVYDGAVEVNGEHASKELLVLEGTGDRIVVKSKQDSRFLLGTAPRHDHEVISAKSSIHTNPFSIQNAEVKIREIGSKLRSEGKL